ncbi:probable cytochrome b-c1 complex subunit 9 [Coccomyxa sp. Obi]|nr:probable cytochrome b-c1 complex subunit 9 [Coccomyxa sp. Obi]
MPAQTKSHPLMEVGYKLFMRRNSVYIAFILGGAILGERVLNAGFDSMWNANNKGKLYKDLEGTVIGAGGGSEEEE